MSDKEDGGGGGGAIRVVVADDHPLYRRALQQLIHSTEGLELAGAATGGREAIELVRRLRPDVLVLDVRMPDLDGIATARRVTAEMEGTRVLFLSAHDEGSLVMEAIAAGGSGYLSKAAAEEEIKDAILRVGHGEDVLATDVGGQVLRHLREQERDPPLLSERERQVLTLVAGGASAPEAAARLNLAVPTVKTHLQNVYAKLGVSDRGAAVAEAMRRGMID